MIPVYKDMNSYPYKRNHMPSTQYYHPNWEGVSPQMKEDPSSSPCTHESWPYNYGYPVPMQCSNCCTHGQHPGYYNFRPPCSHFPPPPPPAYPYFYGGYPPYPPQSYPMYYAPPPHCSMELPRYEYEKSRPGDQFHCCGCLNHPGHVKGGNNVKIEEQEPDAEVKKSEAPFPARANNFPHPIMWIPPEYVMNKEQPKRLVENEENQQHDLPHVKKPQVQQMPSEIEAQENKGIPHGRKPHQSVLSTDQDPNSRYGWFPLDINKIKQLMEGRDAKQSSEQEIKSKDEKKAPDVENKDQNKQPSYPVFWIPYNGREEDSSKGNVESTAGGTATESSPSAHNGIPKKIENTNNEAEKQSAAGVDDGRIGTMGADKKRIVKTIPVKQLEDSAPELSKKESQLEESAPKLSKKEEEHKQQDTAKNKTSVQSSSSTKKPKLPPVCLRIDPPKKKNGNGSLRSPSHGDKIRQSSDESKLKRKSDQQHQEIKVKDVEERTLSQDKIEVSRCAEKDNDFLKDKDKSADVHRGDYRVEAQELRAAKESECQQESKQKKKIMSEMEAAAIIQAACRGRDVRRSEPIKKLKQIAKVHEEATQVRKHLEDLESRAPVNDKEKATVGETIMKLLLELDSMQGLHPSIRDVRRSVAKELISLQEKLDSIMSQQSTVSAQDSSTARAVEEPPKNNGLVEGSGVIVGSAGQPIKDSSLDGDKNVNTDEGHIFTPSDLSSSQPLPCQDGASGFENRETSEDSLVNMAAKSDGDIAPLSLGTKMKEEPDVSEIVQENTPMKSEKPIDDPSPAEDAPQNDLEFCSKNEEASMLSKLPSEVVDVADNGLLKGKNDQEQNLLMELHQDVDDELWTNVSRVEDRAVENDMVTGKEDQADIMSELPRDVEEDDERDDIRLTDHDSGYSNKKDDVEQPHEDAGSTCNMEKEEQEVDLLHNLSPEVNNDDGNELTMVDTGSEHHKAIFKSELPRDVVEEDKKDDVRLIDHDPRYSNEKDDVIQPHEDTSSTSKLEKEEQEVDLLHNFSPEVNNDDDNELSMADTSLNLNKDLVVDHPSEKLKLEDQESKQLSVGTVSSEPEMQQSKEEDGALEGQSIAGEMEKNDKKVIEENEKLRAMLEKLLAAEKEQQEVISSLNGKVKDLEKKLDRKKSRKITKLPRVRMSRPSSEKLAKTGIVS